MYECAEDLIRKGLAYVCELTPEQMREYRGDLTTPARSPYRDRPIEESLDLFRRMKAGEFPNGAMTLRAKIDLASGNFNMRDPAIYRINHMPHHATGDKWCIYPMYDFAHPIEDAMEHITHSLCSLEFEAHRPLYNWVVEHCDLPSKPRQIEFARLGINYTVMSKRKLRKLVEDGRVAGWDDPRMPTLCGLRRRGYTPHSIRSFCERIGVAKAASTVEYAFLEHCLREDLNDSATRTMAVLHPLRLTVTNYPEGQTEIFEVENHPNHPEMGKREIPFSRDLWIEQDDFMEEKVGKFFRLFPGNEVRLKGAYVVKCTGCVKDADGNVTEVLCEYDPASRGGDPADGRKVKSTIHWVEANEAVDAEVRLYSNLFTDPDPDAADKDFLECLNPDSLEILTGCKIERSLAAAKAPESYQFMRLGYFCPDSKDSTPEHPVFNRSVSLDSYKPQEVAPKPKMHRAPGRNPAGSSKSQKTAKPRVQEGKKSVEGSRQGVLSRLITRRSSRCKNHAADFAILKQLGEKRRDFFDKLCSRRKSAGKFYMQNTWKKQQLLQVFYQLFDLRARNEGRRHGSRLPRWTWPRRASDGHSSAGRRWS